MKAGISQFAKQSEACSVRSRIDRLKPRAETLPSR
jgi:hypothetical protein